MCREVTALQSHVFECYSAMPEIPAMTDGHAMMILQ